MILNKIEDGSWLPMAIAILKQFLAISLRWIEMFQANR